MARTTYARPTPISYSANAIQEFHPRTFRQRYPDPSMSAGVEPTEAPDLLLMLPQFVTDFSYPLTPTYQISPADQRLIADILNQREQALHKAKLARKRIKERNQQKHDNTNN